MHGKIIVLAADPLNSRCTNAMASKPSSPLDKVEKLISSLSIPPENIDEFKNLVAWCMYAKDTWPEEAESFDITSPRPRIDMVKVASYIRQTICPFDLNSQNELNDLIETFRQAWDGFAFADQLRSFSPVNDAFKQWPVNIQHLLLRTADLVDANLEGITIADFSASEFDCSKANLRNAKFERVRLPSSRFAGADLSGASIEECEFPQPDFSDARLVKTRFTNTGLQSASFIDAKCTETLFERMDVKQLAGANFTNTDLSKAKINLGFKKPFDLVAFDLSFNHCNNEERGILRTVDSIDDQLQETKVEMMEYLLDIVTRSLQHDPTMHRHFRESNISLAFGDVLLQNPLYVNGSKEIKKFVQDTLVPALLSHWNNTPLQQQSVSPFGLELLASYLTAGLTKPGQAPGLAASHKVAIEQILTACRLEPSLETAFVRLYDAYGHLNNRPPQPMVQKKNN